MPTQELCDIVEYAFASHQASIERCYGLFLHKTTSMMLLHLRVFIEHHLETKAVALESQQSLEYYIICIVLGLKTEM